MSFLDKIKVNAQYTRSINLERDSSSEAVVKGYIPTSIALQTLERIGNTMDMHDQPRAWSLVGPYGSGKSAFAVFLTNILSSLDEAAHKASMTVLNKASKSLASGYKSFKSGSGHCVVMLTGSSEALSSRLVRSLHVAAENYWARRTGAKPKIIQDLKKQTGKKIGHTKIIALINELQLAVSNSGGNGVLIVVDELGKFLEFEARGSDTSDIYLLQMLAEHAYKANKANLTVIAMLHQSFEQYARGMGKALRDEWSKVHGRFENIPFIETSEQVLRVVSAAFETKLSKPDQAEISKRANSVVKVLAKESALPGVMKEAESVKLLSRCYPLHPVSSLILPKLCQKVAQNERTLFSYLGSSEPHGFKNSLRELQSAKQWIEPWEIYEYFLLNQSASLLDPNTHRAWSEVMTAVDRLGDAPEAEVRLLKTIGLLNILGIKGGLKASKQILGLCLPVKKTALDALKALEDKSLINYRKFSGEYRVWQGSDFDLEEAISDRLATVVETSVAGLLNTEYQMQPIVARAYTIETGALRYFMPVFADDNNLQQIASEVATSPRVIFYLKTDDQAVAELKTLSAQRKDQADIYVTCHSTDQIVQSVRELSALHVIDKTDPELGSDPVARRTFNDRLSAVSNELEGLLSSLLKSPSRNTWIAFGEDRFILSRRGLQQELSAILHECYSSAPTIKNELINRDKLSAQGATARNKLMAAMLLQGDQEELAFDADKYPPEKSIYRSFLKQSGFHRKIKGEWGFAAPTDSKLKAVWAHIESFLDSTENTAKSLEDLKLELTAAPYGVKEGVIPVLLLLTILIHQSEISVYEDGTYTPYFAVDHAERLVKRPDVFTVQRIKMKGANAALFEQYSKALFDDNVSRDLLDLVRKLATSIGRLPKYAKTTTQGLSGEAIAVRKAFELSSTPVKLLLEDIPKALCVEVNKKDGGKSISRLSHALKSALHELVNCQQAMQEQMRIKFCEYFGLDAEKHDLASMRHTLAGKLEGLDAYTIDTQGQRAFIQRIVIKLNADDVWFEELLMFLGKIPIDKWTDQEVLVADMRLKDFARKIKDLSLLQVQEDRRSASSDEDFEVYLLKNLRKGGEAFEDVVFVEQSRSESIRTFKKNVIDSLSSLSKDDQKAVLAEVLDELFTQTKKDVKKGADDEQVV
jgi:hypothetical protein